ncbi:hypothetical protein I601_2246 [Nocardioides dokdonensis FR1436]|uniref:Uncharacterized protein n=1 Tax=Nocardioides dokdonensis FR1436 TaxID=1300347 RepID=A0A1A9GMG0_9ACTN|nr:hypothetical protein [Nocardioides dokdonensis]ANH38671.1 hypothetical protein I601_2246 [Nocardioides dokdonensis FR1436]
MITLLAHRLVLLWLALVAPAPHRSARRDERGDVPGWVLVTVMSAGIVVAIGSIAQDELSQMLRNALNKVK